jgi:hypothetical protein
MAFFFVVTVNVEIKETTRRKSGIFFPVESADLVPIFSVSDLF